MPAEAIATRAVRTGAPYDPLEVELAREIRQLAWEVVRLERCAREAADRAYSDRVSELQWQRELALARRSRLMRELWASWRR